MPRVFVAVVLLLVSFAAWAGTPLRDRIGVAHAGGRYSVFNGDDYLTEGARQIRYSLGSRVIKLWLTREPASMYRFDSPRWNEAGAPREDLAGIASHRYFRQVFEMPFSTIILVIDAPAGIWFGDGMRVDEEAAEERAMYELTRYLIETYQKSGKTFILQNWESDWLLRLSVSGISLTDHGDPPAIAVEGMIRWINARQRGVERARNELRDRGGVIVKHAIEVNHVMRAKYEPSRISAANDILPAVRADMVSYSAWETSADVTGALLREMLAYIDEKFEGSENIYVGEYGSPENEAPAEHLSRIAAQTHAALDWGAQYVVYWQLYCNEFVEKAARGNANAIVLNSDMRGFWLIRPDGTHSPAWFLLKRMMQMADTRRPGHLPTAGRLKCC